MIRVLVLAPFRYTYGSKSSYMTAGESIYLDPGQVDEREELKYILSPASEYKHWLYVDEYQLDSSLIQELKDGQGEVVTDYIGKEISPIPVQEVDFTLAPQEPEPNIFLQQEINSTIDTTGTPEPVVEEEPSSSVSKENRQAELEEMHWKKLEKLATSLGITYETKEQAITAILEKEF